MKKHIPRLLFGAQKWLLVLVALSLFVGAKAQNYRVSTFTQDDGLTTELTKSIAQDPLGNIWIASDEGLIRFNGTRFDQFRNELISPYCKDLALLPDGRLFSTSDNGLMQVHSTANGVHFSIVAQSVIQNSDTSLFFPKHLFVDKRGQLWMSDHFAAYRLRGKTLQKFKLPVRSYSYDWQRTASLFEDSIHGMMLIAQTGQLYSLDTISGQVVPWLMNRSFAQVQAAISLSAGRVLVSAENYLRVLRLLPNKTASDSIVASLDGATFLRTRKGNILIGTWLSGLYNLQPSNLVLSPIKDYPHKLANKLYESISGDIWATSDNGIVLLQEKSFENPFAHLTQAYVQSIRYADGFMYCNDGYQVLRARYHNDHYTSEIVARPSRGAALQAQPSPEGIYLGDTEGGIELQKAGKVLRRWDLTAHGRSVFYLFYDAKGRLWACQDNNNRLVCLLPTGELKFYGPEQGLSSRPIVLRADAQGRIFVGSINDSAYLFRLDEQQDRFLNVSPKLEFKHSTDVVINDILFLPGTDNYYLASSLGLLLHQGGQLRQIDQGPRSYEAIKAIQMDSNGHLWFADSQGLVKMADSTFLVFNEREGIASKNVAYRSFVIAPDGVMWVGSASGVSVSRGMQKSHKTLLPFFTQIRNELSDDWEQLRNITSEDFLSFEFASAVFPAKSVKYEWRLLPNDTHWQALSNKNTVFLNKLIAGEYTLQVRAKQQGNYLWSDPLAYHFRVSTVWYKNAYLLMALAVLVSFGLFLLMRLYVWNLNARNRQLERLVQQRTEAIAQHQAELELINSSLKYQTEALNESAIVSIADRNGRITYVNDKFCEISQYAADELIGQNHNILKSGIHPPEFYSEMWTRLKQGVWRGEFCNRKKNGDFYWVDATIVPFMDEHRKPYQYLAIRLDITKQKESQAALLLQKNEIELQHRQISSSIDYAARIQEAVLRSQDQLERLMPDSFILFRPKHRVSGDFFWTKKLDNYLIVAAADCTGHGVPGGFLSMMGISLLNEIVVQNQVVQPANILEQLRQKIKSSLQQKGTGHEAKDGMDISICCLELDTKLLHFAAANNSAYLLRQHELMVLPATRNPVGLYHREKPFTQTELQLKIGDRIYLYSDGFLDQFGGPDGEKFMKKRFAPLLLQHHKLPMARQKDFLDTAYQQWKGEQEQVDDVLVMGFRV